MICLLPFWSIESLINFLTSTTDLKFWKEAVGSHLAGPVNNMASNTDFLIQSPSKALFSWTTFAGQNLCSLGICS